MFNLYVISSAKVNTMCYVLLYSVAPNVINFIH